MSKLLPQGLSPKAQISAAHFGQVGAPHEKPAPADPLAVAAAARQAQYPTYAPGWGPNGQVSQAPPTLGMGTPRSPMAQRGPMPMPMSSPKMQPQGVPTGFAPPQQAAMPAPGGYQSQPSAIPRQAGTIKQ